MARIYSAFVDAGWQPSNDLGRVVYSTLTGNQIHGDSK
jgi:hypothetical protein